MASNPHVESVLAAFPQEKASDAATAFLSKINDGTTSLDLKELNDHLLPKVYFRGNEFSVDDLHLYKALHNLVSHFNDADRVAATNVTRWFDHVQHISGVSAKVSLPQVAINLNASAVIASAKKQKAGTPAPAAEKKEEKKEEVKATPPAAEAKKADNKAKDDKQKEKQEQIMKAKQERAQLAKEKAAQMPKQERQPKAPKPQGEQKQQPQAKKGGAADADERSDIEHLDVRVGKILSVKRHPDADSLYVEEIDVGEPKPRTIVSGLVKYVTAEELQNRVVVVLANLKPRPLKGIASHGMVLCTSNEGKTQVEPLVVPEGVPVGERVFFGDKPSPHPADAELNPKKKYFEKVQPDWKTNNDRVAVYKDLVWNTSKGPITTATITNGTIS